MDLDKNLLVAIALSIAVYVGWFAFIEKRLPHTPPPATATSQQRDSSVGASTPSGGISTTPSLRAAATDTRPVTKKKIATSVAEIEITSQGAALSSYRFRGPLGLVELVEKPNPGLFATWPDLKFDAIAASNKSPYSAAFEARHPAGFTIQKEYQFDATGELNHIHIALRNFSSKTVNVPKWDLDIGPGLGTVESEQKENPKLLRAIGLFPPPPGRSRESLDKIKPGEQRQGEWKWLAMDNRYFLAAAVASHKDFESCHVETLSVEDKQLPWLFIDAPTQPLAPGASRIYDIPFFLGPKSTKALERMNLGLERSVNFGWIQPLGRFMLNLLHYFYRVTGNYGWSIILLTFLLQMALFPLTYKSLKSMMGMRKVQPEIAKIQQKYKEDPKRLNMELMELYRAKGVNPMGGCLPMLVQMPVFVALYNTLRSAWELHGAPWMFWIKDLSAHDPFYILPVIMGGIMFVQNKTNPAVSADPAQAQMMQFMPIIFTFMFLKFPAGLVLYWLTNSLLNLVQQSVLRKQLS